MRILMERGRGLLRRGAAGLGAIAQLSGLSPTDSLPLSSPRIRRAVLELSRRGSIRLADEPSAARPDRVRPFAYCVRARLVQARSVAGPPDVEGMKATCFHVVYADPEFLEFLGEDAPGVHVFELRCAGLETFWRSDLAKVQETRRPVRAGMTVHAGADTLELEHLAYPVLEAGRIVEIRGWFDDAYGTPLPSIDWRTVRHVRRKERSRTVTLPRTLTRSSDSAATSDLSVLYGEDPGIRPRFRSGAGRRATLQGRH